LSNPGANHNVSTIGKSESQGQAKLTLHLKMMHLRITIASSSVTFSEPLLTI
jgi:hypothetical protein